MAKEVNSLSGVVPHLTAIYKIRNYPHSSLPKFRPTNGHLVRMVYWEHSPNSRFILLGPESPSVGGYLFRAPGGLDNTLVPYHVDGVWDNGGVILSSMVHVPGLSWGTLTMVHLDVFNSQVTANPVVPFGKYRDYCAIIDAVVFKTHERASGVRCEYSGSVAGYRGAPEPCPRCGFRGVEEVEISEPGRGGHAVTRNNALSQLMSAGAIWW